MKKLITVFILLIIAAGVAFYFGWVKVEPGTFAVAHSTITGTLDYPLETGNLHWIWQKLIPKTFYLFEIQKEPFTVEIESTTALPRSENLTDFGTFNLSMNVKLQYSIDFDSALTILNEGSIENFHPQYKDEVSSIVNERASAFVVEGMTRYTYNVRTFDYTVLGSLKTDLEQSILQHSEKYKLADVSVSIIFTEIPQLDVYAEALKKYYQFLESLYALKEEELKGESSYKEKQRTEDIEFYRLKKYGELIEEYPDLLKYFYIQKFGEKAEVMVLPQDEATGFPKMLEAEKALPKEPEPTEKKPQPEDTQTPGAAQEQEPERAVEEKGLEPPEPKKWYEYFMFWKHLTEDKPGDETQEKNEE
jgi:hypothetical protein